MAGLPTGSCFKSRGGPAPVQWQPPAVPCINADMTKHPTARRNLLEDNAAVFLDDALIHGGSFEKHLGFIYSFLYAMEEQQLPLSAPKPQCMMPHCSYLGHVLSGEGVAIQPARVAALREWPVPKSVIVVRAFLGFCVYLRRHIKDFGEYAAPLSALTIKTAFSWGTEEHKSFETCETCVALLEYSRPRALVCHTS